MAGARGDRDMAYDGLNRLTSAVSPMFGTATYGYDVQDNLTHVQLTGGGQARNQDYCYDARNQLTNIKTGGCSTGLSVVGLGYDVQGNLSNKNGVLYGFDYGNRMRGGGPETYRYDAYGRRARSINSTGQLLYSLYSQSGQLLWQRDERTSQRRNYVYLQGSLLAEHRRQIGNETATVVYQHTDALGTPVAITNSSKTVIERREYEPYGYQTTPALADGPGYTGHAVDAATGLVYMQQRYYDPAIGEGLSVDPVTAYDSKDWRFFNRYAYAFNNPYKFYDQDGRCPSCVGAVVGGLLELGFQLTTAQGRASYAAAASALARGNYMGAVAAAGANVTKVGASAAAGAVGAGLAGKIAQGANMISKAIQGSTSAANLATNVGIRVAGNAAAGAALSATTQGAGNAASGQSLTNGMAGAAVGGALGGAAGAGVEAAAIPAAQNLANATGRMIDSSAGLAAPGAGGRVTAGGERTGAIVGAFIEKAATCTKDIGGGC